MAISAQAVKQLKELTNCGMMDCKRALEETNGDVDAAIKNLREKGLAKAAKKSGRIAAEGLVYTKVDEAKKVGVVVEINVETDFAAKTDRFIEFVELVANTIIDNDVADVDDIKIYVFTPFSIIRDRWYSRAATRGKTGNAADMQFENVNQAAQIYIRPTMQTSDIVVNGLTTAEYIEEITEKIINAITSILHLKNNLENKG